MTTAASTSPYASPSLHCDIVMKGGITSGVIYPRAVSELAKTYTLSSVGGASAGAIAEAAPAAAQVGRHPGRFVRVHQMPDVLGAPPDEAVTAGVRGEVTELCRRFPIYAD